MTKVKPTISCDRCVAPGMCCRAFPLNHNFPYGTALPVIAAWLEENGLGMFRPLRRWAVWTAGGTTLEQWQHSCTKLMDDGRCGIYDERPEVCRLYEPGSDMMCVHVRGMDGKPVVPQLRRPR